jgi:hypothetical protein
MLVMLSPLRWRTKIVNSINLRTFLYKSGEVHNVGNGRSQ